MLSDTEVQEIILHGIDENSNGDELSALAKKPVVQAAMVKQILQNESGATRKRKLAISYLRTFAPALFKEVLEGKIQLSDKTYYAVKRAASAKVIIKDITKRIGITNFSNGEVDNPFLVTGMKLEYAVVPANQPDHTNAFSDKLADLPDTEEGKINNGEFSWRVKGRDIVDFQPIAKLMPRNNDMATNGNVFIELDNPKLIMKGEPVEFYQEYPVAPNETIVVKVMFDGIEFRP